MTKNKIKEEYSRKKRFDRETIKIYEGMKHQIKEEHELPDLDELNNKINIILDALGLEYDKKEENEEAETENSEETTIGIEDDNSEDEIEEVSDDTVIKEDVNYVVENNIDNEIREYPTMESLITYLSNSAVCDNFELDTIEANNQLLDSGLLIKNRKIKVNKVVK